LLSIEELPWQDRLSVNPPDIIVFALIME